MSGAASHAVTAGNERITDTLDMEPLMLVTFFAAVLISNMTLEIWAETSSAFIQHGWDDFFWSVPVTDKVTDVAVKLQATLPEVEYLRELCSQPIL
jgi:hypothetical protein